MMSMMGSISSRKLFLYLSLFTLAAVSTSAFFIFWQRLIVDPYSFLWGSGEMLWNLLYFGLSAAFFIGFASLIDLLAAERKWRFGMYSLLALIGVPFFAGGFSGFQPNLPRVLATIASLVLFAGALIYFSYSSRKLLQEHIKFNPRHILGPKLGLLITVLSLIFSLNYYVSAQARLHEFKIEIPDFIFKTTFELTQTLLSDLLPPELFGGEMPSLGPEDVQGEAQLNCAQLPPEIYQTFPGGRIPPQAKPALQSSLPPGVDFAELERLLQLCAQNPAAVVGTPGEAGGPTAPFAAGGFSPDILKDIKGQTEKLLTQWLEPHKKYAPPFFTLLAFILIRSLAGLAQGLGLIVATVVIKLLRGLGWVKIIKEKVEAERLVIE